MTVLTMLAHLGWLATILSLGWASLSSERDAEKVKLKIYQMSESEWSESEVQFKALLAAEASRLCAEDPGLCGLLSGFNFTSSAVGLVSGPERESKSLVVHIYVDFPSLKVVSPQSSTRSVVNSEAVQSMVDNIHSRLEEVWGRSMTHNGGLYYSIPPNATLNQILIPVAVLVLIAVLLFTLALHTWSKRKEKEEKKKKHASQREKKKKPGRIAPTLTMNNESHASNGLARVSSRKSAKKSNSEEMLNLGHVDTLSLKTNMTVYNQTGKPTSTEAQVQDQSTGPRHNSLPPLEGAEDRPSRTTAQEQERKPDKKERRRRRKERRQQQEGEGRDGQHSNKAGGEFSRREEEEDLREELEEWEKVGSGVMHSGRNEIPVE